MARSHHSLQIGENHTVPNIIIAAGKGCSTSYTSRTIVNLETAEVNNICRPGEPDMSALQGTPDKSCNFKSRRIDIEHCFSVLLCTLQLQVLMVRAHFTYSHFTYSHSPTLSFHSPTLISPTLISPTLIRLLSHFTYTHFAYSHFAYSHFAYSHFTYSHFAYSHSPTLSFRLLSFRLLSFAYSLISPTLISPTLISPTLIRLLMHLSMVCSMPHLGQMLEKGGEFAARIFPEGWVQDCHIQTPIYLPVTHYPQQGDMEGGGMQYCAQGMEACSIQ